MKTKPVSITHQLKQMIIHEYMFLLCTPIKTSKYHVKSMDIPYKFIGLHAKFEHLS
jgi:hypothetical protein